MSLTPRVALVKVDLAILSSYPIGASRTALKPLSALESGMVPEDVAKAILALHNEVLLAGGDFRVTDCLRSMATQLAARARYENWLDANKPKPGTAGFDSKTMKADFVAEPGYSFHNAGRSIDVHLDPIVAYKVGGRDVRGMFPNVPTTKQLDTLWDIAKPLGWRPIIKAPTEGVTESWHFDFLGPWAAFYDRTGDYKTVAMCACLDIGVAEYGRDDIRALQAQLQRAGYDCGAVDGYAGGKTSKALAAAGFSEVERDYRKLFALPTANKLIWKAA